MTHRRVLIVGTVPYKLKSQSRAFDAYFHNWERENLAQVFSDPRSPEKGHCGTLYQITDHRLFQRWKGKRVETGKIYGWEDIPDPGCTSSAIDESEASSRAYRFGARHTPLSHLLRGLLWRKRLWRTPEFDRWLEDFRPEAVFLSFSDDYFIPKIALYVAEKFDVPIVSSIGDDYYFNSIRTLNPLYYIYKCTYRRLIRRVFAHGGSANYISDKIRDKYNSEFGLGGETVYLTSTVRRKPFAPVDTERPLITYFGNIRMGRNHSLNDIGHALGRIDPEYVMEVYSGEKDPGVYAELQANPNIRYGGSIPYTEVAAKMASSDVTVIVEGMKEEDVYWSRYSLSTKAADALASGATILTYGNADCGIVEYMKSTGASFVCTEEARLEATIREMFADREAQAKYYERQIVMTHEHHNIDKSCATFEAIVDKAIENYVQR